MRSVEQSFLEGGGIPGRPWFKHVLYAPKYTYAAMTLPGVQEAVDKGDWTLARAQLAVLTARSARSLRAAQESEEAARVLREEIERVGTN